ncbi:MAG: hypothetical protein JWM59_1435 [Verrucomicrobiales bacterium]|nr:hypothetical protein [Verrucomicrobiales bacterium]
MLISIVGTKGSQGKSTLAHALAFEKGFGIITNDIDSSVDEFLPEDRVLKLRNNDALPEIPKDWNVIFDGKAGIDEPIVREAVSKSDWVLIPTIYGVEELKRALRAIHEVEKLNPKIVVVPNMVKLGQFEEIQGLIRAHHAYPLFPIRFSKFVAELLFLPESIEEKHRKGGLMAYSIRDVRDQFQELFRFLGV